MTRAIVVTINILCILKISLFKLKEKKPKKIHAFKLQLLHIQPNKYFYMFDHFCHRLDCDGIYYNQSNPGSKPIHSCSKMVLVAYVAGDMDIFGGILFSTKNEFNKIRETFESIYIRHIHIIQ